MASTECSAFLSNPSKRLLFSLLVVLPGCALDQRDDAAGESHSQRRIKHLTRVLSSVTVLS